MAARRPYTRNDSDRYFGEFDIVHLGAQASIFHDVFAVRVHEHGRRLFVVEIHDQLDKPVSMVRDICFVQYGS